MSFEWRNYHRRDLDVQLYPFSPGPISYSEASGSVLLLGSNRAKKLFRFIFRRELLFCFTFAKEKKEKWATKLFLFTFIKDLVAFSATMVIVIVTQVGWYNKVSCYTKWGRGRSCSTTARCNQRHPPKGPESGRIIHRHRNIRCTCAAHHRPLTASLEISRCVSCVFAKRRWY